MPEVGKWNSHTFVVSPNVIRSFTGLTIKGSSETEDKESGNQKYVSRKNGKPEKRKTCRNLPDGFAFCPDGQ